MVESTHRTANPWDSVYAGTLNNLEQVVECVFMCAKMSIGHGRIGLGLIERVLPMPPTPRGGIGKNNEKSETAKNNNNLLSVFLSDLSC